MTPINIQNANITDKPAENKASHCINQTDLQADFDTYAQQIIATSSRSSNPVETLDLPALTAAMPKLSDQFEHIKTVCGRIGEGTILVYLIDDVSAQLQQYFKTMIDSGAKGYLKPITFRGRFIFWSKDNEKIDRGLLTWINRAYFP